MRPKDYFKSTRKLSDENCKTFINLVLEETWQTVYDKVNLDEKSEIFMSKIVEYFNIAFPLKRVVVRANQINKINLSITTRQMKARLLRIDCELKSTLCEIEKHRLRLERARLRKQVSSSISNEIKVKNDLKINNASNKSSAAWRILKDTLGKNKTEYME